MVDDILTSDPEGENPEMQAHNIDQADTSNESIDQERPEILDGKESDLGDSNTELEQVQLERQRADARRSQIQLEEAEAAKQALKRFEPNAGKQNGSKAGSKVSKNV